MRLRAASAIGIPVLLLAVGCQGEGSDIGPRFPPLPEASSKVSVYDDQNRGVVGATVSVVNSSIGAITGRNGRSDLLANPSGRQLMRIDGSAGAAVDGDLLGMLQVAKSLPGGDIPTVFHLPDANVGGSVTLNIGTQPGSAGFSNPTPNGGTTFIPAGTSVGVAGGATTVTVRSGTLQAHHLPGDLPSGVLMGRGLYFDPPDVTFTPPVDILVLDDLMATGTVALYRLDPATGEWVTTTSGNAGGGVISALGAVSGGGLFAFGVPVTTGSVAGRIVDAAALPNPIPAAMVNIDGRWARSDGSGNFLVTGVPAQAGDGSPRTATIEVFAGGSWMPALAASMAMMNGVAQIDVGDIELDTVPAGNIRIQQVKRARAEGIRNSRISSLFGSVALAGMSDASGQLIFEDVPSQWFGFQIGFPKDHAFAYYSHAVGFSDIGRRWLDVFQFFGESAWFIGSRSSRILATDALGGGPLFEAAIVRGTTNDVGLVTLTREGGIVIAERSLEGRATASISSARDGRTITHAFSIDTPNGEHLEMPLQQALRFPLGAFDRHGLVSGTVTGANPAATHRLRATRRLELQEWWDDVVEGIGIPSSLPIDVDPAITHGPFKAGLDPAGGHLVAAELDTAGSVTLQKLAIASEVIPVEGSTITRDLPLDQIANTSFSAPGVLAALDPGIAPASLSVSLALGQPSGRVVDVVRGLTGNHSVVGADLTLNLPALTGQLAGHSWYGLVHGSTSSGGVTVTQRSMLHFGTAGAITAPALLSPPTISQPAPSGTVASSGFTTQFTLPAGIMYATLQLRSDTPGELLLWEVVLPPSATGFSFTRLPVEATTPLIAGRTYSLTLSAYWSTTLGPFTASNNPYRDATTYWQSIGSAERGVDAVSSVTFQVTSL